jgi:hypothetical protein
MVTVTINNQYGTVIGEDMSGYCVNVHIVGQEHRGKYAILKSMSDVKREDLEHASEEIMKREIKEEE